MGESQTEFLQEKARLIRDSVIAVSVRNGAGHIAPSLSCVEILVALYYGVLNYRAEEPDWPERDRVVFSKAHGAYALYAVLADLGTIPREEWENFYTDRSSLPGCVERCVPYGLDAGCGALGHGLPMAVGMAFAARLRGESYHTYCIMGDGETQEGSTWEAVQFAVMHELGNLTLIVDRNRLQAMDFIKNVMDRDDSDIYRRFQGFGLEPLPCPGHDTSRLQETLRAVRQAACDKPGLIIAETVKGQGLACMQDVPKFHFRIPTEEELKWNR